MRRWNGWGDDTLDYPLPPTGSDFLAAKVGEGFPRAEASLESILASVPPSRLPPHPLISTDPEERLRHARGQSFPDWLALRSGRIPAFPDGVAYPISDVDVRALIDLARLTDTKLIPYGGGTSVVGHINPLPGDAAVLAIDLSRLNRLRNLDESSQLATFDCGVTGPDLEAQLRARGYTLGHFPQSFELSTLGGWVATRSSGQQSLRYGRIEKLFAGGKLESPSGTLILPSFPASAAGLDLREIVLGSEGRLGVITEATVRITPLPQREDFHAVFFLDWDSGLAAVQEIVQARLPLSMMRYSTTKETETTLALAGHERLIATLERLLSVRGIGDQKCMFLVGFTGSDAIVKLARKETLNITGRYGGVHVGRTFGSQWHKGRFKTAYLRNTLWEQGYGVDTLETAIDWNHVSPMITAIEQAINNALAAFNERSHIFTHLSHLYPHGSSIYTTYLFLADDPAETLSRWQAMKTAASKAIVAQGGTISHQHGIGVDHLPYLEAEKGKLGLAAIDSLCKCFDPDGMMNPGKLITHISS
jgi:alkyldihydroxyacetonephosphate synthase